MHRRPNGPKSPSGRELCGEEVGFRRERKPLDFGFGHCLVVLFCFEKKKASTGLKRSWRLGGVFCCCVSWGVVCVAGCSLGVF